MLNMIYYFLDNANVILHDFSNYAGLAEIRKAREQIDKGDLKKALKTCYNIINYITASETLHNVSIINKLKYRQMLEGIEFYITDKDEQYKKIKKL